MGTFARGMSRLRDAVPEWWAGVWRWVLLAAGIAGGVYLILDAVGTGEGVIAAAALGVLLLGVVLTRSTPLAIALLATPAVFVTQRLPLGGASGLTVSDAALAAGLGTVVLLGKHGYSPPLRALLWLNAVYQFTTLFTLIVNPYPQNTVEFFHAWLLISGALIVGWGLGRGGYARLTFGLMLGMAAVIAAGTFLTGVWHYLHGDFSGVYPSLPWPMHKNFAGGALAFAAFLAYLNPDWAGLPRRWVRPLFWALLFALAMTQSRQAIIGLLIALLVNTLRTGRVGHAFLISLLAIPAAVLVALSVKDQVESQNIHNSFYQRLDWLRAVYALWKHDPLFGHGLRYWYVDPVFNFQPPQGELEVVASAGLVGLAGFVVMWIGIILVLWRVDPRFGMLALGSVLARLVQGQFDLFWVSAQVSIPFLIAGVCLGAQALNAESTGTAEFWTVKVTPEQRRTERRRRRDAAQSARLPSAYDRLDHSMKG